MQPEPVLLTKLIEDGTETGAFEMDERGYTKFIPKDDEIKAIEQYLGDELTRTLDDYQPLFAEAVENVKCYRHLKVTLETGKAVLPAPVARIPADHIIASTFTAIVTPRPIVSFDPYYGGEFPVVVPTPAGMPLPSGMPMQVKKNSEDLAQNLEKGMEFKLRERLDFEAKLLKAIRGAVTGCPYWWKVCANPSSRTVMRPKADGLFIDPNVKYLYRQDGEIVQLFLVPFFNFIRPLDVAEDELDEGPWCAERTPREPNDVIRSLFTKEYFLIKDETDAENLAKIVSNVHNPFQEAIAAMTQQKAPQKPRQLCNVWHVPFYRDALYKDPDTGEKTLKRLNLVADFHLDAKRLLNCYLNPNEHQSRAYVLHDQMEEGDSTVKILRWHQDVATHLMQAQIKNVFIANNLGTWSNSDGDAGEVLSVKKTIEPGEHLSVPGKFGEDWGVFSLGTNHESMLPTWQAVVAEGKAASKVTGIAAGENLPGRTPAQTMEQAIQQGSQENLLFLRRSSRCLSRVFRYYIETCRQYQPMGETIPIFDPVLKQAMEIPFRFPDMLDNFRIALTAADQALAHERNAQQITMWKNIVMQDSEFVAKIAQAIVDQRTTPALMAMFEKSIARNERLLTRIIQLNDSDANDFDLTPEITAIVKEREQILAQIQAQPPAPPQPPAPNVNISLKAALPPEQEAALAQALGIGGTNANQATQAGGNVSGPQGQPNAGRPAGAGDQPNVPPPAGPAPTSGIQGPQQGQ